MLDRPSKPQRLLHSDRNNARDTSNWYILEAGVRALDPLTRLGLGLYEPKRRVEYQHRRSKKWITKTERLMAGYIFVEFTFDERPSGGPRFHDWDALLSAPGVYDVMSLGEGQGRVPYAVPTRIIERLMLAQAMMEFDDTRAARRFRERRGITESEISTLRRVFPKGSPLLVTSGTFKGHSGVVERVTDRGEVLGLVKMLGRFVPVFFPHDDVAPVAREANAV